jgi:diacylglycerol kinase family enzyme
VRVLVVNNLVSGLRDGMVFDFVRSLSADGDEIVIRNTDGKTAVEHMLTGFESFDMIIAAGGDGTISTICYETRYSGVPILPIPAGTGNLLFTNLDLPDGPHALAMLAREPLTLDFDLGELSFELDGEKRTCGFVVAAGAGYDADIMKNSEALKPALGPGSYLAAAMGKLTPTVAHFDIELDGQHLEAEGIAALILNFAKINPDISITHKNNARDGLFEVVVLKSHSAVELLPALFAAFLDREGEFPGRAHALETHLGKDVRITATPALPLQYDGEAPGSLTPISAHILPLATRLVISSATYDRLSNVSD